MSTQQEAHADPHAALQDAPPALDELSGTIRRVRFQKNGFGVVEVQADGSTSMTVVAGAVPAVRVGERLWAQGVWQKDPKFGLQLKASKSRVELATSVEALTTSLAALVDGVGPTRSRKAIESLGGPAEAIARLEAEDAGGTPEGLQPRQWAELREAWQTNAAQRRLETGLVQLGLSPGMVTRVRAKYGTRVLDVCRTTPYQLCYDIDGIGFARANEIAMKAGVPGGSLEQKEAALVHSLREDAEKDGHVFLPRALAANNIYKLCKHFTSEEDVAEAAEKLVGRGMAIVGATGAIGLKTLLEAEKKIAQCIADRLGGGSLVRPIGEPEKVREVVEAAAKASGFTLTDEQEMAVGLAYLSPFMVLTGGPGVGKTTVTRSIVAMLNQHGLRIGLGAPTGRAARRLSEATNMEAMTIHRLLGYRPQIGWTYNAANPMPYDVVLIDETSMLDVELGAALCSALESRTRLIFVGDADQLPPVGPGAVFRDLVSLENEGVPVARLTKVHRQAAGSQIIKAAASILRGSEPEVSPSGNRDEGAVFFVEHEDSETLPEAVVDMVTFHVHDNFGISHEEIQVVAPMRKGCAGVANLNAYLRDSINPLSPFPPVDGDGLVSYTLKADGIDREYRIGDRIMQMKNDADRGVVNGEIGKIKSIEGKTKGTILTCVFPDGSEAKEREVAYTRDDLFGLEHAYASTVHKVQGAEFAAVVVVCHDSHWHMLERALLYTAVTRGKKLVVLVGTRKALGRAVRTARNDARRTTLPSVLAKMLEGAS